jgi:hypothetical protein
MPGPESFARKDALGISSSQPRQLDQGLADKVREEEERGLQLFWARPGYAIDFTPLSSPGLQAFREWIVQIANWELARWGNGAVQETDPGIGPVLQRYWRIGTGNNFSLAQLANPAFQAQPDHSWSAAFISWVMRTANAQAAFNYSQRHTDYTRTAKANRQDNNSNPFKAYRTTELAPEAGDLVCRGRPPRPATYDDLRRGMTMHCDIVTEVQPGSIVTVGGNVGGSVRERTVPTDPSGLITAPHYFAVIRISRTQAPVP